MQPILQPLPKSFSMDLLPSLSLALFLLIILTSSPLTATSTDVDSLLSFKAHATDPHGILSTNWTTTTSFCNWFGVQCNNLHEVTSIRLRNMSLQGTISPRLSNLSSLSHLDLANNTLTGFIPESIGHLPRLAYLNLELNMLSGSIPSTIFNISLLTEFYISSNNLSGTLPQSNNRSFTMLPRIQIISLGSNQLMGDVPSSFAHCHSLQKLSLANNHFSGTIPTEIGSLPELTILYLGQNQLSGMIPDSLGNLTKLAELDLSSNNLGGVISEELGNLPSLQYLSLSNNSNLIGSMPLMNNSLLYFLDLSVNKLSGSVPVGIGKSLPFLNWFNVGGNQLTGGLEFLSSLSNCMNLQDIGIWGNNFGGILPDSVGNLSTNLQAFHAYGNQIKGSIPAGFGNLTGLTHLTLQENELSGTIPSTLARLGALGLMVLQSNRISGPIPFELGQMENLFYLDLEHNALSGSIPDSLANISMIQYLVLGGNKLLSSIPQRLWVLKNLLYLDLSNNSLSGSLPMQVRNLMPLTTLDLSMNQLSGNISGPLGDLQMLTYLDLSKNSFRGQIPQTFGGLISSTYLNLSYNSLSGPIPNSLANLSYLDTLDLSYNKLEGQIPKGRIFSNLSIVSLMGNEALCGAPRLGFPPCTAIVNVNSRRKPQSLKYILPITAFSVVLLTCVCFIYVLLRRRKVKTLANNDDTHLDAYRVVSRHEIVRATTNFSEDNLLGRGSSSSVYKGNFDDGSIVAVKVLNLEVEGALKSFDAECQVLRMVRHRNLIKVISVCSSSNFKALVLEFMPNGSLEQWLYSEASCLNLLQRLNIMVEVSLALEYLHHHHPHVVLHCDLKPRNVLLDEEMVAHVGDFGIAKLLSGDGRQVASASMPGTIGYIAPEYASTGTVSRMGDVYSFGLLLLETFTGKKPVDVMFGEESSLREWVSKAYPTTVLDVVDCNLLKDHSNTEGRLRDLTTIHQCVSSIFELGLLCSRYSPKERIPMTEVATRLQKIRAEYLSN